MMFSLQSIGGNLVNGAYGINQIDFTISAMLLFHLPRLSYSSDTIEKKGRANSVLKEKYVSVRYLILYIVT